MTARVITWLCEECGAPVQIPCSDGYLTIDSYREAAFRVAARHGVERWENHPILIQRMGPRRLQEIRVLLLAESELDDCCDTGEEA